jgi:hypothetical protein
MKSVSPSLVCDGLRDSLVASSLRVCDAAMALCLCVSVVDREARGDRCHHCAGGPLRDVLRRNHPLSQQSSGSRDLRADREHACDGCGSHDEVEGLNCEDERVARHRTVANTKTQRQEEHTKTYQTLMTPESATVSDRRHRGIGRSLRTPVFVAPTRCHGPPRPRRVGSACVQPFRYVSTTQILECSFDPFENRVHPRPTCHFCDSFVKPLCLGVFVFATVRYLRCTFLRPAECRFMLERLDLA